MIHTTETLKRASTIIAIGCANSPLLSTMMNDEIIKTIALLISSMIVIPILELSGGGSYDCEGVGVG